MLIISTSFNNEAYIYYVVWKLKCQIAEGSDLFNDTFNTIYLRYGVEHVVKISFR